MANLVNAMDKTKLSDEEDVLELGEDGFDVSSSPPRPSPTFRARPAAAAFEKKPAHSAAEGGGVAEPSSPQSPGAVAEAEVEAAVGKQAAEVPAVPPPAAEAAAEAAAVAQEGQVKGEAQEDEGEEAEEEGVEEVGEGWVKVEGGGPEESYDDFHDAASAEEAPAPGADKDADEEDDDFHDANEQDGFVRDAAKAQEMKEKGNSMYKAKEWHKANDYYTMAIEYCPEEDEHKEQLAVFYSNRAASLLQVKDWDSVVEDCSKAVELKPGYVKALMRRAQAYEGLEKFDMGVEDCKAVLEVEPSCVAAKQSLPRLEAAHKAKMEAMKDEALGKLKEMGNSLLGHFGMSLDNFKMEQDPGTGSYSINFNQGGAGGEAAAAAGGADGGDAATAAVAGGGK